ncbi:hypothetical protein VKT23_018046 [Stygiomarasmius scandens]|uniref:C3H1-type domain-containing protein n=1 Tax=Marasmiellus scandens TaxID=2682957 RepID=A0ABR1ITR0_9AGAR
MSYVSLAVHTAKRAERARERARGRERLKTEGDNFFKQQRFAEAAESYEQAIRAYGRKPVLLSNLAQAYLKLGEFEKAEEAATAALIYDPSSVKARFRRGQARKGRKRVIGAAIDYEQVLKQEPSNKEAKSQLKEVRDALSRGQGSASDAEYEDDEYEWPFAWTSDVRESPWLEDSDYEDSGTSDCEHIGNMKPCRYHNGNTRCRRGAQCWFSHAPDDWSVRDEIGKNVCLLHLLGGCKNSATCSYSHNLTYLPEDGWWADAGMICELESILVAAECTGVVNQREVLEMIYTTLYQAGYKPPRNLELIMGNGTRTINIERRRKPNADSVQSQPSSSFILVISMDYGLVPFDGICGDLIKALQAKITLVTVQTPPEAIGLLSSPHLKGVLLPDHATLQHRHEILASKLVEYTKAGGRLVYGGVISCNVNPSDLGPFFRRVWDLPWEYGEYTRLDLVKNTQNETARDNPSLPTRPHLKCVHLKNVSPDDSVYKPAYGPQQTPLAHTKFGKGYMGYVGDVNCEEASVSTTLAMFGLFEQKNSVSTDPAMHSDEYVLVISLEAEPWFENMDAAVFEALRAKTRVIHAESAQIALQHLEPGGPTGVFVTTSGIVEHRHAKVLAKLVEYAKGGGKVVIGAHFSGHITGAKMASFWNNSWGLPWKMGSYHRATFYRNDGHEVVKLNPSLPESFSVKTVHLDGIEPSDAVYRPTMDSRIQSLVFPSEVVTDLSEAPVVQRKVGKGYVGYIGDVNAEKPSTMLVLAMLGLLSPRPQIQNEAKEVESLSSASGILINNALHSAEFNTRHAHLLSNIQSRTNLMPDSHPYKLGDTSKISCILINDPEVLRPENKPYIDSVVEYVRGGGRVVFAGMFSSLVNAPTLDEMWKRIFGLPWKMGSYYQSEVELSKESVLEKANTSLGLKQTLSMKAVHLRDAGAGDTVYCPKGKNYDREAPVLFARMGEGYVGYVGDVNGEEDSTDITLAMLGLN